MHVPCFCGWVWSSLASRSESQIPHLLPMCTWAPSIAGNTSQICMSLCCHQEKSMKRSRLLPNYRCWWTFSAHYICAHVDFSEHLCCKHVCLQVSALWVVNHTNVLKAKPWSFSVVSAQAKQKIKMSSLESQLKGGRIGNFCPQIIKKLSESTILLTIYIHVPLFVARSLLLCTDTWQSWGEHLSLRRALHALGKCAYVEDKQNFIKKL